MLGMLKSDSWHLLPTILRNIRESSRAVVAAPVLVNFYFHWNKVEVFQELIFLKQITTKHQKSEGAKLDALGLVLGVF